MTDDAAMTESLAWQPLTTVTGVYKAAPEDFEVVELLPFIPGGDTPGGDGEHVYLQLRKRGRTTLDVQRLLAEVAGVPRHLVGYAGLKDSFAVTTQWFSVHLPGASDPDWRTIEADGLQILQCCRHRKKLRTGAHSGNAFTLRLRDLPDGSGDTLSAALERIRREGFPNAFGEQRFGRGGSNLQGTSRFGVFRKGRLSNRQQMVLSAVRSYLFNQVLARRVIDGSWNQALPGDLINLDGSNSFFGPVGLEQQGCEALDDTELSARMAALEVHPTGPLPGVGREAAGAVVAALERDVLAPYGDYRALLERVQVKAARRSLRARAQHLQWSLPGDDPRAMELSFQLGRGAYATSLLAYLGRFEQASGT